jgi:hypothetical protein
MFLRQFQVVGRNIDTHHLLASSGQRSGDAPYPTAQLETRAKHLIGQTGAGKRSVKHRQLGQATVVKRGMVALAQVTLHVTLAGDDRPMRLGLAQVMPLCADLGKQRRQLVCRGIQLHYHERAAEHHRLPHDRQVLEPLAELNRLHEQRPQRRTPAQVGGVVVDHRIAFGLAAQQHAVCPCHFFFFNHSIHFHHNSTELTMLSTPHAHCPRTTVVVYALASSSNPWPY